MKKKITFPDWTGPAGQIITRDGENGKRFERLNTRKPAR